MTACTERPRTEWQSRKLRTLAEGEGQKGTPKESTA